MLLDLSDQLQEAVDWIIRLVSGLGFFLPIAIFAIFNILSGKGKQEQDAPADRRRQPAGDPAPQVRPQAEAEPPIPIGPFGLFDLEPAPAPVPSSRSRDRRREDDPYARDPDEALQWGSAFAANDAEKANSALRWGSIFDDEREQSKWGWDESEWGGDYAPKPSSEPKITVG